MIWDKRNEVFDALQKHSIDKESGLGVFLMLKKEEELNLMLDFLNGHKDADQTAILEYALKIYQKKRI